MTHPLFFGTWQMERSRSRLDRLLGRVNGAMAILGAIAILFMMLAICCAVILRYLWNRPLAWVVEISSYLMLYITFLGTAWLQRKEGHVEVDLFLVQAKPKTRAFLKGITSLGGAVVTAVLAWKGSLVTIDYFERGVTVMGILNTPQYLLVGIIPIGGFLLGIEFTLRALRFGRMALKERAGKAGP